MILPKINIEELVDMYKLHHLEYGEMQADQFLSREIKRHAKTDVDRLKLMSDVLSWEG